MPTDTLHRLLLDNLTTAVILLNGELRLEYMNPAAEMLLAVSGQRSHGQFISELFTESPEALNSLRQAVEQAHPFTKREATLTSITGVSITVDYAVTPILNRNETLLLLEVHPRDRLMRITREEAQLSKQETTKLLVRGLAHEIKNPLGGIRGAAQLLSRELPEESLKDYTNVIIEEADRLRNLVDRMLGSNKLPNLAPTNIHEVLERVSSLVEAESQGSITLVRDYDPSIPDLLLDREQMIQAVLNMVRNAMQAIAGRTTCASVASPCAAVPCASSPSATRVTAWCARWRSSTTARAFRPSSRKPSSTPWSAAVRTVPDSAWPSPRTSSASTRG